jgi:hypothetical protein
LEQVAEAVAIAVQVQTLREILAVTAETAAVEAEREITQAQAALVVLA